MYVYVHVCASLSVQELVNLSRQMSCPRQRKKSWKKNAAGAESGAEDDGDEEEVISAESIASCDNRKRSASPEPVATTSATSEAKKAKPAVSDKRRLSLLLHPVIEY